jgi:hypothetical protein
VNESRRHLHRRQIPASAIPANRSASAAESPAEGDGRIHRGAEDRATASRSGRQHVRQAAAPRSPCRRRSRVARSSSHAVSLDDKSRAPPTVARPRGGPQRHAKELGAGKEREGWPTSRVVVARRVAGRRHARPSIARPTDSRSPATACTTPACITLRSDSASTHRGRLDERPRPASAARRRRSWTSRVARMSGRASGSPRR